MRSMQKLVSSMLDDILLGDRLPEARPARAGIELRVGMKSAVSQQTQRKRPSPCVIVEPRAGEGLLGALLPGHLEGERRRAASSTPPRSSPPWRRSSCRGSCRRRRSRSIVTSPGVPRWSCGPRRRRDSNAAAGERSEGGAGQEKGAAAHGLEIIVSWKAPDGFSDRRLGNLVPPVSGRPELRNSIRDRVSQASEQIAVKRPAAITSPRGWQFRGRSAI